MDTSTVPTASNTTLAFLGFREFENGEAYRGAILVTDEWSKPLEFRCTAPVRPTALQRTLYGQSLLPHILTELIGAPLISSVREKPLLVLIKDEAYFDMRHKLSMPIIRINRPNGSVPSSEQKPKSRSISIQSASGKYAPVDIEAHWKFANDLDATGDRLRDLFGRWDLTEPFQRLAEGLQYVHDEQVLES